MQSKVGLIECADDDWIIRFVVGYKMVIYIYDDNDDNNDGQKTHGLQNYYQSAKLLILSATA